MRSAPRAARWPRAVAVWVVGATAAWGQSPELIDSVRVHRPGVVEEAKAELESCLGAPPKQRPCAEVERLTLLLGYLQLSDGDAAGAAKTLAGGRPPKGLEAFHAWYLGEAQAWSGQRAAAVRSLAKAKKTAPAWLAQRIELRTAELWLALGQAAKAKPILEPAAEREPTPELLYARALARQATGEPEKARTDYRQIYLRFPTHPHASLAATALASGARLTLTVDEALLRAQALIASGEPAQALSQLEEVEVPDGRKARVALVRGQALLARGKDVEGFAELALAEQGPALVAGEALATRAKRLMRVGDNPAARAVFTLLDTKYPNDPFADDAGYFAAWLAMNSGELETAAKAFADFEARHPRSSKRDEARWFRAYSLFRLGRYPETRAALLALVADHPRSSLVPQARYWAARAAQLDGAAVQPADGTSPLPSDGGGTSDAGAAAARADGGGAPAALAAEYAAVVSAFPGSFYALLASERLREAGVAPPPTFTEPPKQLAGKPPPGLALAIELGKAGLLRDELEEVQRAITTVGPEGALAWGHALQRLDEFGAAYTLGARYLWGAAYTLKKPEAIALLYPRAFRATVEKASGEVGLDPHLAWAIMRRESAFRPEVTSIADARGLLQLIPPTARSIAAERKIEAPAPDELYSPERNIQFGTWYLAALRDRLGHETLCAAAYNAGANAVLKWLKERGELPLDQFVEEIPWKETRGYVKQVTADYYLYQHLYSDKPVGRLPLTLPAPKKVGVSF